ncbi:S-adenosyl-L-methionine-dependent methyltransferase [Cubamyces lactineus]|nr:S-adenosyl-L-methionine-dependent methyltransferase [Cubamyces lactineus]
MSKRNRPSAWDVSFPTEAVGPSASFNTSSQESSPPATYGSTEPPASNRSVDGKRPRIGSQPEQRRGGPSRPKLSYVPSPQDVRESANTLIFGEDPLERDQSAVGSKPIRALSDFSVFDPSREFEMIPLALLDTDQSGKHHFEAAGAVAPVFLNEEDEGQEDVLDGEDDSDISMLQRLRTSAIFRYTIDYMKSDDPLYLETEFSWYELRVPSTKYRAIHQDFYRPHRVAQVVISTAIAEPTMSMADFSATYISAWDQLTGEVLYDEYFRDAIPLLWTVLNGYGEQDRQSLLSCPFLHELLSQRQFQASSSTTQPVRRPPPPQIIDPASLSGNLDIAVLQPNKQNPTHVSPLIDGLALGLFHEHLKVVGPPQRRPGKAALKRQQAVMTAELLKLIHRARVPEQKVSVKFPAGRRLFDQYWAAVIVDDQTYEVGDCIIVEAQDYGPRKKPKLPDNPLDLPEHVHVADFCWFAKIIYIDQLERKLHVQWYEHGSKTFLQEICDPHELYLWPTCSLICVKNVLGKARVTSAPVENPGPLDFFCRFTYNETDASFVDINPKAESTASALGPPSNCACCLLKAQQDGEMTCTTVRNGIAFGGHKYHRDEYVLYHEHEGPAGLGRIIRIHTAKAARQAGTATVELQLLGRMSTYFSAAVPGIDNKRVVHEREVYFTDDTIKIDAQLLIKPCFVVQYTDVDNLQVWLDLSPYHFFVKYHLPSLDSPWSQRTPLKRCDVRACASCLGQDNLRSEQLVTFASDNQNILRTFDPFGGVGAFGLAMEEVGCIKFTHAVEITPSAALTLKKNSPDTIVYNQCSNLVYKYAVKTHLRKLNPAEDSFCNLLDGSPLPPPPRPGDIDCLVAGFPCQPHSHLNMFRKANDRKSHLMLNLLSWVDFLKPKYCFFENVRGFLSYNLHARQAGRYRVEGGIKMGGLKFFVRCLLAMGYQVRFSLLQAAHYGAPQSRARFFLIAALQGHQLPQLPQPTHDFPLKDALEIKFPNQTAIQPILTLNGTAPCKYVSVTEAIGDLPEFDWQDPQRILQPQASSVSPDSPRPAFKGDTAGPRAKPFCGFKGPSEVVGYKHVKPCTSFQAKCRSKPSNDLQHYTRTFPVATVERVINVPLSPDADYRQLNARLWPWHSTNPNSAIARDGFRPGLYGRLNATKWFHTTVTNVEPSAKQSYVLHPWCRRILTVRELARSQGFPDWFVFYSIDNNVKTLQRHIGNAVPWPVSEALARELKYARLQKWLQDREDAIEVDSD